jgi:hypothetical protein
MTQRVGPKVPEKPAKSQKRLAENRKKLCLGAQQRLLGSQPMGLQKMLPYAPQEPTTFSGKLSGVPGVSEGALMLSRIELCCYTS